MSFTRAVPKAALGCLSTSPRCRLRKDGLVAHALATKRVMVVGTAIWKDAGLNMILPSDSRDLALRLLAWETDEGEVSELSESVHLRVYEKLRRRLCALAGVAGFNSLASRALALTKSEVPDLSDLQVAPDGSLLGFGKPDLRMGVVGNEGKEGETILIARLLGLLLIFLGEALTLTLISDLWPDATPGDSISGNGRKA